MPNHTYILFFLFLLVECKQPKPIEDNAPWQKIKLDFKRIDQDGLTGPANGKTAVNYEFCIPKDPAKWKAVKKMDPSAQKPESGRGRIGCSDQEWLIFGNTHQKNYRRILYELAQLPYVKRIEETFYE
jgi:hypothetical protein